MSSLAPASTGLVFCSLLYRPDLVTESYVIDKFKKKFELGFRFYHSFCPMMEYYSKEMGEPLSRLWLVSRDTCERENLVDYKHWAHEWEQSTLQEEERRLVNCDVGLILPDQMLLATGKPYSHRVYLKDGVYGELTYTCHDGDYQCLPWTYPDYKNDEVIQFFNVMRGFLVEGRTII